MLPAPGLKLALCLLALKKKSPASLQELKHGDLQAGECAKTSELRTARGSEGEGVCECALSVLVDVGRQMAEPCTLTCT